MPPSWLKAKGYENIDQDVAENTRSFGTRHYWMPPLATQEIAFLADDPPRFHMHQVKLNGIKQPVTGTCPDEGSPDCPLCAIGDQPYYVGVWPIANRKEWTDKKGNKHKDGIELLVAKGKVMTKLARRSEALKSEKKKADGLTGLVYKVSRGDDKSPATGDDFELKAKLSPETLAKLQKDMPDLMEELKPDLLKLARIARKLQEQASGGGGAKPAGERVAGAAAGAPGDDIPWKE